MRGLTSVISSIRYAVMGCSETTRQRQQEHAKQRIGQFKWKVFAVILLAGSVTTLGVYFGGLSWSPKSAAVSMTIWNETDQPVNASTSIYHIYLYIGPSFNITSLPAVPVNISLTNAYPVGRTVSIKVNYLSPHTTLTISITDIIITRNITADLGEENMYLWVSNPPNGVGCTTLLTIYGETPFGRMSLGSSYQQLSSEANIYPGAYTERYNVHALYYVLVFFTVLIVSAAPIALKHRNVRQRWPFATFFATWVAIFLYIFFGSAWEIAASGVLQTFQLLIIYSLLFTGITSFIISYLWKLMERPMSQAETHRLKLLACRVLTTLVVAALILVAILLSLKTEMHGSYYHITDNLAYFLIIGCACEGVANAHANKWRFTAFFILPLALYGILGFGLSTTIETMAILFGVYAVVNREFIAKSRVKAAAVFISGVTLSIFYGWLLSPLTSTLVGYDLELATNHIMATIVTFLVVGALYWLGSRRTFRYSKDLRYLFDNVFKEDSSHDG